MGRAAADTQGVDAPQWDERMPSVGVIDRNIDAVRQMNEFSPFMHIGF